MKKINYRHFICIAITLGFIAIAVFIFPNALGRIIEGGRDLGLTLGFYFCKLLGIENNIVPTVNDLPKIPFFDFGGYTPPTPTLPKDYVGFKEKWALYWQAFINKDYILYYITMLVNFLSKLMVILLIIVPFFIVIRVLFNRSMRKTNNKYNKDSLPLKCFKLGHKWGYKPVKDWLLSFYSFIMINRVYRKLWLLIWLFNFNIFTIILEFIAFYLYFSITFDFINIYTQIYKLVLDLSVPATFIPLWLWVIVALYLFDRFRKNVAYSFLNRFEMRNRGFINERPITSMICGSMGKCKTTMTTDMALSQEIMLRNKAYEKILENDLKFPFFPWINLENEIKLAIEEHKIYTLATCRQFINERSQIFFNNKTRANCFNYDFNLYGEFYDDKLKVVHLFDVLETYCQLYFIYIIQSSLILSNLSIRSDNRLMDMGNFPLWNTNFFRRDSRLIHAHSRHAHILDFDCLRLGRKVLKENPKGNAFEFGVVVITEIGKERGNNLELKEVKKKTDDTNQKNDLFNTWLKMVRHSATVDNFPFVKVFTDEQRPSSWGADARELSDIIFVKKANEPCLSMPFFNLGELLYSWIYSRFISLYSEYRFNRGDNTLLMHVIKGLSTKMHSYYKRIYNRFSYIKLDVQVESGTLDGKREDKNYYLMPKKIYSNRFSSDCFSDVFTKKALTSNLGLNDLEAYSTYKATFDELLKQNSHFISDLENINIMQEN